MNLGYNSIFLPGFVGKVISIPVRLGPVSVLWFTPAPSIVTNNIDNTLKASRIIRQHVGIVSDAHSRDAYGSNEEAQLRGVGSGEAGIDVRFKVASGPFMTLP